jgi:hypothetical protein
MTVPCGITPAIMVVVVKGEQVFKARAAWEPIRR